MSCVTLWFFTIISGNARLAVRSVGCAFMNMEGTPFLFINTPPLFLHGSRAKGLETAEITGK